LNRDKYFEFASLTDINFERTLLTYYLIWFVGYNSIKHWKASKSTAFAPFFKLVVTFEHTESWETTKTYAKALSNVLLNFLSILNKRKIDTCKNGSWTPPI
jgi:hypothetical protein